MTTPAAVVVRSFQPYDRDAIKTLLVDLPQHYPDAQHWLPRRLRDVLAGRAAALVAVTQGNVCGIVVLTPKSDSAKISTLYVAPDYRHNKVATKLMERALDVVADWGHESTFITVADYTAPTLSPLLTRFGFKRAGDVTGRYGAGRVDHVYTLHLP